jgi:hypothetical protein
MVNRFIKDRSDRLLTDSSGRGVLPQGTGAATASVNFCANIAGLMSETMLTMDRTLGRSR